MSVSSPESNVNWEPARRAQGIQHQSLLLVDPSPVNVAQGPNFLAGEKNAGTEALGFT